MSPVRTLEHAPILNIRNTFARVADKFIVDDQWCYAPDQAITTDAQGNASNYIVRTNAAWRASLLFSRSERNGNCGFYQVVDSPPPDLVRFGEELQTPRPASPPASYKQLLPDMAEWDPEPPNLPPQLATTIFDDVLPSAGGRGCSDGQTLADGQERPDPASLPDPLSV